MGKSKKEVLKLEKTKASQKNNISTRIIKESIDIFADFLRTSINSAIDHASFPSSLKLLDVIPWHKKGRKDMKENFWPVSTLPAVSKIFEKCMFAQMSDFFDNIFLNKQCGFRKVCSTQNCLR